MKGNFAGSVLRTVKTPREFPSPVKDKPWDDRIAPERVDPWPDPPPLPTPIIVPPQPKEEPEK